MSHLTHLERFTLIPEYRRFCLLAAVVNITSRTGRSFAHYQEIHDYIRDPYIGGKNLTFFMSVTQEDFNYLSSKDLIEGTGEFAVTPKGQEFFKNNMKAAFGLEFIIPELKG